MKLLAIETSTEACSAAIMQGDQVFERFEVTPRKHNELILPMCEQVLAQAEISLKQLDAIAFGCGPGAFTGVRIGTAVTQGIAYAHDLPVVPVSTLANLAQQAFLQNSDYFQVLTAIDARMDEIYWAIYKKDTEDIVKLSSVESVNPPDNIDCAQQQISFGLGSGWETYAEVLVQKTNLNANQIDGKALPHASVTAQLAVPKFIKQDYVDAAHALPVYLRNNVAQKKKS